MKKSIKVISICCSSLAALVIGGLAIANNTNIKSNAKDYQISMDYQNVTNFSSVNHTFDLEGKTAVGQYDYVISNNVIYGDKAYSAGTNKHILEIEDTYGYTGYFQIYITENEGPAKLLSAYVEGTVNDEEFKNTYYADYGSISIYEAEILTCHIDKLIINYSC